MSKKNGRIREKNNLKIENFGDTVIIKNRSAITGGVSGALLMVFIIAVAIIMRAAWSYYLFWLLFAFLFLSSAYWCVSAAFGKIVLNSPKMTMTVYSPLKKEYKFRNINYVDVKSAKPKDGFVVHTVSVYIGDGKKSVKIDTLSSEQAEELSALLRGMLDNAAMEYPEGNEEPFNLDKEEKKAAGSLLKLFKKKVLVWSIFLFSLHVH